jgi:hypothetical protein
MAELESGLEEIRQSPRDAGELKMIVRQSDLGLREELDGLCQVRVALRRRRSRHVERGCVGFCRPSTPDNDSSRELSTSTS